MVSKLFSYIQHVHRKIQKFFNIKKKKLRAIAIIKYFQKIRKVT
jgi:hypothetical protein